jgi:hypothetical protein
MLRILYMNMSIFATPGGYSPTCNARCWMNVFWSNKINVANNPVISFRLPDVTMLSDMHTVKPVSLEMELDFHERLLHTVGKSIASTKKRLHDAELVLNLRPPDHEAAEIEEWNAKVAQLIDRRGPLEFPTLYKVRKEYESKALIKSIRTGRQKIESDEKFNQRMNRKLAREAEMIKKKILSNTASFGKKVTGDPIRTIEGYKGKLIWSTPMFMPDRL